jgi:hypothetical protein
VTCPPCKKPGENGNKKREKKANPVRSYKGKKRIQELSSEADGA